MTQKKEKIAEKAVESTPVASSSSTPTNTQGSNFTTQPTDDRIKASPLAKKMAKDAAA